MIELTRPEMETVIRRSDDDRHWNIYSACRRDISRIRRMVSAFGGEIVDLPYGAILAKVPLKAITFRSAQRQVEGNPFEKGAHDGTSAEA